MIFKILLLVILILFIAVFSKFISQKRSRFRITNYFNLLQYNSNTLFGLLITIIIGFIIKFISLIISSPILLAMNGHINLGLLLLVSIVSLTVLVKTYLISLHTNKFEFISILSVIIISLFISITLYFITMELWSIDWEFIPVTIPVTGLIHDSIHPSSIPSATGTGGTNGTINGSGNTNGSNGNTNGSNGNTNGSGNANGSNGNANGSNSTNGSNIGNLIHNTLIHYGSGSHGSGYLGRAIYYVSHNADGHSGELIRVDGSTVHFDNFRSMTTRNGTIHTLFYQNATTPGGNNIEVGTVTTDSRGESH
jgi:hypothetical protein